MVTGSCLCGKVKFLIHGKPKRLVFDHCSRCRKSTGSAFSSEVIIPRDSLELIEGVRFVKEIELPVVEKSPGYKRTFCTECGSPLPTSHKEYTIVPAGTIDQDLNIKPLHHIFTGKKTNWFEIADQLPQYLERERLVQLSEFS